MRVAGGDIDALADMTGLAIELDEAIGQALTCEHEASAGIDPVSNAP